VRLQCESLHNDPISIRSAVGRVPRTAVLALVVAAAAGRLVCRYPTGMGVASIPNFIVGLIFRSRPFVFPVFDAVLINRQYERLS
jgi:hypothetical protein